MMREWTDQDGRTWRVSVAEPAVEGGPYLVEFASENEKHRTDYAGAHPPERLTSADLQDLLNQTTS